jgi:hypothetical protein
MLHLPSLQDVEIVGWKSAEPAGYADRLFVSTLLDSTDFRFRIRQ